MSALTCVVFPTYFMESNKPIVCRLGWELSSLNVRNEGFQLQKKYYLSGEMKHAI